MAVAVLVETMALWAVTTVAAGSTAAAVAETAVVAVETAWGWEGAWAARGAGEVEVEWEGAKTRQTQ